MTIQLIQQYHAKVEKIIRYSGSRNEGTIRKVFQDLLEAYASGKNLLLIPEIEVRVRGGHRVVPDGTLKDALRQDWGYWESKDEKDNLDAEIAAKLAKGYPTNNILFEDSKTAVLYQNGGEVARAEFSDEQQLDTLLMRFFAYEPLEVTEFHRAIQQFNADVPALASELRTIIEEQYTKNQAFHDGLDEFLGLAKKAINPRIQMANVREMIIQHILTEDIFMTVFDEPQFHRENAIARKLQEVVGVFYFGATRRNIHERIAPYYETINARAAQIHNHHEKQKFLKALYENFYRAFNPKAADRLGIIYTPDEIVRFMIGAADHLVFEHFGRTLGDKDVEILDPATGTGTFITELIEYLPDSQLPYKYKEEIHCNEVAILPYYIANLNIEYTYKQKTGQYVPFDNICFVDTLDNTAFQSTTRPQLDMFALVDENAERIQRQNQRRISVIIGNPPYNANQLNENENNKNRDYPDIDKRIKETYIAASTAQKTKAYDMYIRFLRWASDRLDKNGVIAFVSNNSFLNGDSYDGFRKVVAEEFSHIYIIDLKGDARTSGERRRREGGNIFSDRIREGIAVYFLVRKAGEKGCHIHYNTVGDYVRSGEKKAYLRDNPFSHLKFQPIYPDKSHAWVDLPTIGWDNLIPVANKATKDAKSSAQDAAIFRLYTLGVSTNRDEWVYGLDPTTLRDKVEYLLRIFNGQLDTVTRNGIRDLDDNLDYRIKWSETLKRNLLRGGKLDFDQGLVMSLQYRPFLSMFYYSEKMLSDRLTSNHYQAFGYGLDRANPTIVIDTSDRPFSVLAVNQIFDLHLIGDSIGVPLYRYIAGGERVDNITDWALIQFQQHYQDRTITKERIFDYVYAVLHHPTYREKYTINLKRDLPRIPYYEDFQQWANWGQELLDLHLNYEQVGPYPLDRKDLDAREVRKAIAPRLMARKDSGVIEIDTLTALRGIPPLAWDYRLGTYSALEWVLERYKECAPRDPTIREKFNTYRFADHKERVIDLLRRVCTVSVETMRIVGQMPRQMDIGDKASQVV